MALLYLLVRLSRSSDIWPVEIRVIWTQYSDARVTE
jgi:hypothetical protein